MLIFCVASGTVPPPRNLRIKLADSILPKLSNYCQKDFCKAGSSFPTSALPIQRRTQDDRLFDLLMDRIIPVASPLNTAPLIIKAFRYWISQEKALINYSTCRSIWRWCKYFIGFMEYWIVKFLHIYKYIKNVSRFKVKNLRTHTSK